MEKIKFIVLYLALGSFLWRKSIMMKHVGQLVEEQNGSCSNGTAVYRCSRERPHVRWSFYIGERYFYFSFFMGSNDAIEINGSTVVMFNVINSNDSFISVTATIENVSSLNGTIMDCHGHRLIINAANEGM